MRNYKIEIKKREEIEPEEILFDTEKEKEMQKKLKKIGIPIGKNVFYILFILIIFIFSSLLVRLFLIYLNNGSNLLTAAKENYQRIIPIPAPRGVIYDKNGEILVENIYQTDLLIDPLSINRDSIKIISEILKIPISKIEKEIKQNESYFVLKPKLSDEDIIKIQTKIDQIVGVELVNNFKRKYKDGEIFSHILGYMLKIGPEDEERIKNKDYFSTDEIGKEGLEFYYEDILRGQPGKKIRTIDIYGNILKTKKVLDPKPGESLILNIDAGLQRKIYNEIISFKNSKIKKGAVVAIDPRDGKVLAMISTPSFDNNLFSQGISSKEYLELIDDPSRPFLNRVLAGRYPTGSSIKPFIASGALNEGVVTPWTTFYDRGYIRVENPYFPSKPAIFHNYGYRSYGLVNLKKALSFSINTYFMAVGGGYQNIEGLGVSRIKKYLSLFGFDKKTGIDLPSETAGIVPDPIWKEKILGESWVLGDTYNLSIGQGYLSVTPLELAVATAAIANDGILLKPQIVDKIKKDEDIVQDIPLNIAFKIPIDKKHLSAVKEGMHEGTISGTFKIMSRLRVSSAGKTGTAEASGKNQLPYVWFTVFAPYENPEIVFTIMLEEGENTSDAVMIALRVLEWYFNQKK